MKIKGQHIVGFQAENNKELGEKLYKFVEEYREKYSNSILIHQIIKVGENEYTVILHEIQQ